MRRFGELKEFYEKPGEAITEKRQGHDKLHNYNRIQKCGKFTKEDGVIYNDKSTGR